MRWNNSFIRFLWFGLLALLGGNLLSCKSELSTKPMGVGANTPIPAVTSEAKPVPTSPTVYLHKEGWHIPVPTNLSAGPEGKSQLSFANGREVEVTIAQMKWSGEYFFTYGADEAIKEFRLSEKRLKLTGLKQLRVGEKVFAYVVVFEKILTNGHHQSNSDIRHLSSMYKIRDSDGDGKFEELFPGDSDGLIPDWVGRD